MPWCMPRTARILSTVSLLRLASSTIKSSRRMRRGGTSRRSASLRRHIHSSRTIARLRGDRLPKPETRRQRGLSRASCTSASQRSRFLGQPFEPVELLELPPQRVVQRQQVAHIFQRVVDLLRRSAAGGANRSAARPSPGRAFRNFVTTEPYDDGYSALQNPAASCVSNKFAGGAAASRQREIHLLAGGVHDRRMLAVGQRLPELGQIAGFVRIDDGQLVLGRHLHQAQLGPKRVLGNKFRIDADAIGASQAADINRQAERG